MLNNSEILAKIKTAIGQTSDFQDGMILSKIEEAEQFMIDAGVAPEIVSAPTSVGVVERGAMDLWNYGAGNGELSTYFKQRVTQLVYKDYLAEGDCLGKVQS